MIYLGEARLTEEDHATGERVRSWDLGAFGGPTVFMGPVDQALPVGTTDRGGLRLDTFTGAVWRLEEGDPPPTLGKAGEVLSLWPLVLVVGAAWLLGTAARGRK